jgi:hypothetical protein
MKLFLQAHFALKSYLPFRLIYGLENAGAGISEPEPNRIGASTPYDFNGKNLTPYGGLLPLATMLEKLGFQAVMEATVKWPQTTCLC